MEKVCRVWPPLLLCHLRGLTKSATSCPCPRGEEHVWSAPVTDASIRLILMATGCQGCHGTSPPSLFPLTLTSDTFGAVELPDLHT